jgi:hypothetical protein
MIGKKMLLIFTPKLDGKVISGYYLFRLADERKGTAASGSGGAPVEVTAPAASSLGSTAPASEK